MPIHLWSAVIGLLPHTCGHTAESTHSYSNPKRLHGRFPHSISGKLCKDNNTTRHNVWHIPCASVSEYVWVCVRVFAHAYAFMCAFPQSMLLCVYVWFCYICIHICLPLNVAVCVCLCVCLVSCCIANGVQTAVPYVYLYTHTHMLAKNRLPFWFVACRFGISFAAIVVACLYIFQLVVRFLWHTNTHSHMLMRTHYNYMCKHHGKTIRINSTIPSNCDPNASLINAYITRIHTNLLCALGSHSHHVGIQYTRTYECIIIMCAHTRSPLNVCISELL